MRPDATHPAFPLPLLFIHRFGDVDFHNSARVCFVNGFDFVEIFLGESVFAQPNVHIGAQKQVECISRLDFNRSRGVCDRIGISLVEAIDFGEVYINKIGPEQFQGFHTGYRHSGMGGDDGHHGFAHYFRKKTAYVNYGDVSTAGMLPYTTPVADLPPQ